MLSFFALVCIGTSLLRSSANPILSNENVTAVEHLHSPLNSSCDRNVFLVNNQSLFELLNNDRIWFVLARAKSVFGEATWRNTIMETRVSLNGTTYLEVVGENRNGSCERSEKVQVIPHIGPNRVSIRWTNGQEGFLEMEYLDEILSLFTFCYAIDANQTDLCVRDQSEQLVLQNNQLEYSNDTLAWLKSHCISINTDDYVLNDDAKKCLALITGPEILEVNTTEHLVANVNSTSNETLFEESMAEDNATVTTTRADLDSTTRTNRTNRLEVLEEYYSNVTNEAEPEDTTAVAIKEIVVLAANAVLIDDANRTNRTVVREVVLVPVANVTVDGEAPLVVLHKGDVNETIPEVISEQTQTTEDITEEVSQSNDTADANVTVPSNSTVTFVTPTSVKELSDDSTAAVEIQIENTTRLTTEEQETSVTTTTVITTTEAETTTTTTELITTTEETTTEAIPADCPVLQNCPFDQCTFARKFDTRGCPTCNCVYSNKSSLTCPPLTCQACLYGHHTDPNGCLTCQCQTRPYPPLGERCPQLNCEPCYFGTVKDEYNCDTCACIRPNIQECPVLNCTYGPCRYGSIKDEDDCPSCDCLLPTDNRTEVNCSTTLSCPPCHLGYVKDADGCATCQCKLRGNVPCVSMASKCQCDYGSYLDADGCETCSCLPNPTNASRQACWELANQANYHNISGPKCGSDGSFYARQCDQGTSKCSCVTPNGIHIAGFESLPNENINCACAVELYQVSTLRMIGHHLSCLSTGNYAPIQCDGRYCSCVDEEGKPIGPSVSVQNRHQLRCVGVYQQLHPERFLLHQATIEHADGSRLPYGMASSLCLKHLEQVRNGKIADEHILIPVCDANGLYASVQCDQSERYCWCVEKKTGVEMDGTRRLNARPNCEVN